MSEQITVADVTKFISLEGIEYYKDGAEVRFHLETVAGISVDFRIQVHNNVLPDGDISPNAVAKAASRRLREIAMTFDEKAKRAYEELEKGNWPFPVG